MNPLLDRHPGFPRRGDPRGRSGDALCPAANLAVEDRLDVLTGVASPSSKENLLKDNSVLARPLDDAPDMLAQLFEKFGNFDLLFEQADTSLTVGKLAAISAVLGLAGCAVAVAMKSPAAMVPLAGDRRRFAAA